MTKEARMMPAAPEIEQALLGVLMNDRRAWTHVFDLVQPDLFTDDRNRRIFQAMKDLYTGSHPINPVTIMDKLRSTGPVEGHYLGVVFGTAAVGSNAEYLARILIEQHILRSLILMARDVDRDAFNSADAFDLLDRVSVSVTDLYGLTMPTHIKTAADDITDLTDKEPSKHYNFGIESLDKLCVFEAGLPHVFAGRPGIGKSIFAVEVMWHLTLKGPVLLFSPEMTLRQVQARILSRETGVPYRKILRKSMDEQELHNVSTASMELHDRLKLLKVDPSGAITPEQVRIRTERAMKTSGVIAFGVDHLHKMKTGNPKTDRVDFERISQCMNGLTEVSKNTRLPSLIMCQLNREVEKRPDKRPNMADLRGSGEIEQDAAVVGLLYRPGYYQANPPAEDDLEISIAKNRDGAVGLCKDRITPAMSRIGSAHPHVPSPVDHTEAQTEIAPF